MAETTGGSRIGGNASAGHNLAGRDMTTANIDGSNGAAVGSGNRVDIHTGRASEDWSDREMLQRLFRQQEEMYIALVGDRLHPRTNPGLVAIVEETRDKLSSLVAANAAQGLRLDAADRERAALGEAQKSLIDSHMRYQKKNDDRVGTAIQQMEGIASKHTFIMVALGIMMVAMIGGGAYMVYISLRLFGG